MGRPAISVVGINQANLQTSLHKVFHLEFSKPLWVLLWHSANIVSQQLDPIILVFMTNLFLNLSLEGIYFFCMLTGIFL